MLHRKVRLIWQITNNANRTQNNDKNTIEYQQINELTNILMQLPGS